MTVQHHACGTQQLFQFEEELTQAIGAAHADVQRKVSELMSGVAAEFGMDPEPMNPDKLRDQFQDIQASFDRKMDARTDEFQRRMRD